MRNAQKCETFTDPPRSWRDASGGGRMRFKKVSFGSSRGKGELMKLDSAIWPKSRKRGRHLGFVVLSGAHG